MKKAIKIIQKDIIQIFRSGVKNKPLNLSCEDSCSEASRLVALWIKRKFKRASVSILKGEYRPKKYHDILIAQLDNEFYLIDPTIWQFFKNKRSILIGEFNSINELLLWAKKIYGGKWENIEKLTNFRGEKEFIKIIKGNS